MTVENILFIVVIYEKKPNQSRTLISLSKLSLDKIKVYLYDNSSTNENEKLVSHYQNLNIIYRSNPSNPGICTAYNSGIKLAKELKLDWVMLLDDDTDLTIDFIGKVINIDLKKISKKVVGFVPTVVSHKTNRAISPKKYHPGGFLTNIKENYGELLNHISAINSASLINVNFVEEIGGFNSLYNLDMLDYWFYREVYNKNKKIYLLDTTIFHSLSVDDKTNYVPIKRYKALLLAEKRFFLDEGTKSFLFYKSRLVVRSLKQLAFRNPSHFFLTMKSFLGL